MLVDVHRAEGRWGTCDKFLPEVRDTLLHYKEQDIDIERNMYLICRIFQPLRILASFIKFILKM